MFLMEGSLLQEAIHLKELLIVNLDLVQQQQELLAEKDRKLHYLRQENESLKSRLERMGRRMSLCQSKQTQQLTSSSAQESGHDNAPSRTSKRTYTQEIVTEGAIQSDGTGATLGSLGGNQEPEVLQPAKKIRIVSSGTSGKEKGVFRKAEVLVKEEELSRTRSCSPSLKDSSYSSKSKGFGSRKDQYDSEILTTDLLYFVPNVHEENAEPCECSAEDPNVLVPRWRVNVVHSLYVMEGTENLNDVIFLKRHHKSETEEKRRKRWDVQRIRDLHLLQKQQHKLEETSESDDVSTNFISLLPDPDRLSYITVDDVIPVSAFGQPLPNIQASVRLNNIIVVLTDVKPFKIALRHKFISDKDEEFALPWTELQVSSSEPGKNAKVKKSGRKSTAL